MNFYSFFKIGKDVFFPGDVSKSKVLSLLSKKYSKMSWAGLQILALKHCYLQLFPFSSSPKPVACVNDTLLDMDEVKDFKVQDLLILERKDATFCFRLEEIVSIFHNDLSRSVLEYEPQFHIFTLTKAFRLPTHPYLQQPFTLEEIHQIMEQMVLKFHALPKMYPEVYLFMGHASSILQQSKGLSNYALTGFLESWFESHGTRFVEKYNVKTRENQSYWDLTLSKSIRMEEQMYTWFLESTFLPFTTAI